MPFMRRWGRESLVHATDHVLYFVDAQGWRNPEWVLAVAMARILHRRDERISAAFRLAQRGWVTVWNWQKELGPAR